MKKLIYVILGFIAYVSASAQTQSLEFHYIAHDRTTPVTRLCKMLEQVYDEAVCNDRHAVIFYMPNYSQPIVVKINLPEDNRDDFKTILSELILKPAHTIYGDFEYANLLDFFNRNDFINEDGTHVYSSVLFNWYVNPSFWKYGYNEDLIASLYFDMEFNRYPEYVKTRILHAEEDGLVINKEYPFGTKNLCNGASVKFMHY